MKNRNILMLLGGVYHDFEGFARTMTPVFQKNGYKVEPTYERNTLLKLQENAIDIVLMYTCLGGTKQDEQVGEDLNTTQTEALSKWVQSGCGLLAAHAATVVGEDNPELSRLMGGRFISHPPQFSFCVYPMFREHPIMKDIEAFSVHDEFYMELHDDTVDVHMTAFDRGICYPMVWSKTEGKGRIAHVAPGHGPEVWNLASYQQLMLQALEWLVE